MHTLSSSISYIFMLINSQHVHHPQTYSEHVTSDTVTTYSAQLMTCYRFIDFNEYHIAGVMRVSPEDELIQFETC
jgi:hypothetical protein